MNARPKLILMRMFTNTRVATILPPAEMATFQDLDKMENIDITSKFQIIVNHFSYSRMIREHTYIQILQDTYNTNAYDYEL